MPSTLAVDGGAAGRFRGRESPMDRTFELIYACVPCLGRIAVLSLGQCNREGALLYRVDRVCKKTLGVTVRLQIVCVHVSCP